MIILKKSDWSYKEYSQSGSTHFTILIIGKIKKATIYPFVDFPAGKALEESACLKIKIKYDGQRVALVGFGTFSVVKRKARKGRNPQTGAVISIPAAKVPKFSAGKTFKDAVK